MGFASSSLGVGNRPVLNTFTPTATQEFVLGKHMWADDPYLGGGLFVYGKAAAALTTGACVTPGVTFWNFDKVPNTANQGFPLYFARQEFDSGDYGWFQCVGIVPAMVGTGVAAGAAIGITAAGVLGTNAAGKQVLGAKVLVAATGTITKTGTTMVGTILQLPNVDGLWVGQAVSGTGVAASSTITAIDANQRTVTLNNAMTAVGTVTITFTYTGFNLLLINSPFAQGAIT